MSDLERVLVAVRAGAPRYHRWWLREHGTGTEPARPVPTGSASTGSASTRADSSPPGPEESPPPWSDDDEERAARLGSVDPWWLKSVADELETVHAELRDLGEQLGRMAGSAIGTAAAGRCALLAATSHERACEAATLAAGARTAGERAEESIGIVARRLAGVLDGASSRWSASSESSPWREASSVAPWRESAWFTGADPDPGPPVDARQPRGLAGPDYGYAAVLRAVRAELNSAIERLEVLVGLKPAAETEPAGWAAQPGPNAWVPEPGTGPRLPATDARRPETDVGVRIARLPDGPRR